MIYASSYPELRLMYKNREVEVESLKLLRQILLESLSNELDVEVIGDTSNRHPGNLYLAIAGVDSVQLLNNLQPQLAFSLGSACDGLNREYSSLMQAMDISREKSETTFRICVGRLTTKEDVLIAATMIVEAVKRIKLHS